MLRALVLVMFMTFLTASGVLAQPPQGQQPMGPGMMGKNPMMGTQAPAIPNLVGNWQGGTSHLHHAKHGFIAMENDTAKLTVTDQKGRIFHGVVEWAGKAPGKDTFSGVIDKDNVTFYFAGHTDGMRIGKMEGPDAFTFYFLNAGAPNPRAGFVEYKRVKK